MFKIFNWLYKILTLPLTIISLPFKIIDWTFKIFGLIVITMVIYYFDWFPIFNSFLDGLIPGLSPFITSIKQILGLADQAAKVLPAQQNNNFETIRQSRDLLK